MKLKPRKACAIVTKVLAFRRGGTTSRGTTNCINEARSRGIEVEIYEQE